MKKGWLNLSIILIICLFTLIHCRGNGSGDSGAGNSIKLSIEIPSEISTTKASIQPTFGDIKTITIIVEGSDFSTIQDTFNFPGDIRIFVPVGINRTFRLLAFDMNGQLIFRGTAEGVTISPGENIVTIQLIPIVEICTNGIDDDEDNLADCTDSDCNGQMCDLNNPARICVNHECVLPSSPSPNSVDLSITKSDSPDPVAVENNLTYTLVVTNNGPNDATGVIVTDTLPVGVTFVSSSSSQGTCGGTNTVTCNMGNLANGAKATVTIVVAVVTTGTIGNTADVVGNETDPNTFNNTATQVTTVSVNRVNVDNLVNFDVESICEPISGTAGCPSNFVGKCSIASTLTNKSTSPSISNLVIRVNTITNGNLLQNADGGPGGVGAKLTPRRTSLSPGESEDVQFIICLTPEGQESFTFRVNVLGAVQ